MTDEPDIGELTGFQRELFERILGMALVWHMPAAGLNETLGVLKDTFRFYAEESQFILAEPGEPFIAAFQVESEHPGIYLSEP